MQRGGGLYGEMDATYNGWEGGQQQMQRKGRGGTNGIQNHPIIFKSK